MEMTKLELEQRRQGLEQLGTLTPFRVCGGTREDEEGDLSGPLGLSGRIEIGGKGVCVELRDLEVA